MYQKFLGAGVASLALTLVLVLSLSSISFAHKGATGLVKQRMDAMTQISQAMKQLGKIVRGKAAYEPDTIIKLAREISARSGPHLIKLFPMGSMKHPTKATISVWRDGGDFKTIASELAKTSQAMEKNADQKDMMRASYKALQTTCKSCHKKYRAKKRP